jgi:hypothetical protein
MDTISKAGLNEIVTLAIDTIDDLKGSEPDASDLHHEIFNTSEFEVYYHEAEAWLDKHYKPFDAIGKIQDYEQDNFGYIHTDLSDPCKVVNMLIYILGEEILAESEHLQERWNDQLTDQDLEIIKNELKELKCARY